MERMSQRASTGCALDPRGCINLESILSAFSAPISEEQAWALCYTFVQCYFDLRDEDKSKVVLSTSLKHVILHKDGYVHQDTFIPTDSQGRPTFAFWGSFLYPTVSSRNCISTRSRYDFIIIIRRDTFALTDRQTG